jgi:hypothetical protein
MSRKHELQDIIRGNGSVVQGTTIQAITAYLGREAAADPSSESAQQVGIEEVVSLTAYIELNRLWFCEWDESKYLSEGAEQKVYEDADPNFVIKVNSRIFYATWRDYLHSLLLHNHFFPLVAYELLGFCRVNAHLHAVVRQPFVASTEPTDLGRTEEFLASNGFIRRRNNDYFSPSLGIILEDLHDENVLSKQGLLYFVDTAFFLTDAFFLG